MGELVAGIISCKELNSIEIEVKLGPSLDEKTDLSPIEVKGFSVIHFDLSKLVHVNSTGIRAWITWVEKIKLESPHLFYNFYKCPKVFIDQVNMVESFLPKKSKVYSFAVPFFCEKCDKEATVSYTLGNEYAFEDNEWNLTHPKFNCEKSKCEYEHDVSERFFNFLKVMEVE